MQKENKFRLEFHSSKNKYEMEIENKFRLDFHSSMRRKMKTSLDLIFFPVKMSMRWKKKV